MILQTIADRTRQRVEEKKRIVSLSEIKARAEALPVSCDFPFEQEIRREQITFICEVKKASPSKGLIAPDFPYLAIAKEYEAAGAGAISCLTEPFFFLGSDEYLREIAASVSIPVLRKDFTVDPYMIYEAKLLGAAAVLLICSLLTPEELKSYLEIAHSLGLSALVEAHDEEEIAMAVEAGARIIGVNNRDLKTFTVDIQNSARLRRLVPENILFVSESGIRSAEDVAELVKNGTNAVLIGETLMRSSDKKARLAELRRLIPAMQARGIASGTAGETQKTLPESVGETRAMAQKRDEEQDARDDRKPLGTKIKLCGICRAEDVEYANRAMPDFVGFVFAKSRRQVTKERAAEYKKLLNPQIKTVGVFVDAEISFIDSLVKSGVIDLVQLHGQEDETYIRNLKKICGDIPVIKAVRVKEQGQTKEINGESGADGQEKAAFPAQFPCADFMLYDTYSDKAVGGTGETFSWELFGKPEKPFFLAGGITPDNVEQAISILHPYAVDVSSGIETEGKKDADKMLDIVKKVRHAARS